MKRPRSAIRPKYVTDDIERDLTPKQLAKVGAISFAYNNVEDKIDELLGVVTRLSGQALLEVSTRINGIDGKIAIILHGAKGYDLPEETLRMIEETLGENVFQRLKKYREAVIHARLISAPEAIGQTTERRAKINEVLLSQAALDVLYVHLTSVQSELHAAWGVLVTAMMIKRLAPDDPRRGPIEEDLPAALARYQDCRTRRQSLPPIPEFPGGSESHEAVKNWSKARLVETLDSLARAQGFPPERVANLRRAILEFGDDLLPTQKKH